MFDNRIIMSAEEAKKVEEPKAEEPKTEAVKPEEVKPEEGEDDEPPGLEEADAAPETTQAAKQSRAERKVRKAMAKLGMKPVSGITRVTIKRGKDTLFVIAHPDCFKAHGSDSYIAFGEIKVEDLSASAAALEKAAKAGEKPAEAAPEAAAGEAAPAAEPEKKEEEKKEEEKPAEPEEAVDETGLNKQDIDLVVNQTKCTRAKAVETLRKNNSDIVNTIMELSA